MAELPGAQTQPATPDQSRADYLWSVAGKKLGYMAGKLALGFVSSAGVMHLAYKYGWEVHPEQIQIEVTSGVALMLHALHDYLKVKTGKSWL